MSLNEEENSELGLGDENEVSQQESQMIEDGVEVK